MKKILALLLALIMCISLVACEKDNNSTDINEEVNQIEVENSESKKENQIEVENSESKKENLMTEVVPSALQGVWLSDSTENIHSYYTYKDNSIKTYIVNLGKGGAHAFSGTFNVTEEKIEYDFTNSTGYSYYSYENDILSLTDANNGEITKLTVDEVMEKLVQEETAKNYNGVITLAKMIEDIYPDSKEAAAAKEKSDAAIAAIKAEGKAALGTFNPDHDKVQQLTWYMSKSMPNYIDETSYIYPYIGLKDNGDVWLNIRLNYTGDNWIFFKGVTFSVDGENTDKTFNYFDIIHDNDNGVVWEYIDYTVSGTETSLLRSIAESNETIIRFSGDEYYYDHVVTKKEKTAILNALTAHNYLEYYPE